MPFHYRSAQTATPVYVNNAGGTITVTLTNAGGTTQAPAVWLLPDPQSTSSFNPGTLGGPNITQDSVESANGQIQFGSSDQGIPVYNNLAANSFAIGATFGVGQNSGIPQMTGNGTMLQISNLPSCPATFNYGPNGYTPLYGTKDTLTNNLTNLVLTEPNGTVYLFTEPASTGTYAAGTGPRRSSPAARSPRSRPGPPPPPARRSARSTITPPLRPPRPTKKTSISTTKAVPMPASAARSPTWAGTPRSAAWPIQARWTTYYATAQTDLAGETIGLPGDLLSATTTYAVGTVAQGDNVQWTGTDTYYYRYYTGATYSTGGQQIGFANGLRYELQPADFSALAAYKGVSGESISLQLRRIGNLSNAQIAGYATYAFQYDKFQRVTQETVADDLRTTTFTFAEGTDSQADTNLWNRKTVENVYAGTSTSGTPVSQETVYTNYLGQTLLDDLYDPVSQQHTYTYEEYDAYGDAVLVAPSSAVAGYAAADYGIQINATSTGPVQEYGYQYVYVGNNGAMAGLLQYTAVADGLTSDASGNYPGQDYSSNSESYFNSAALLQESYTYAVDSEDETGIALKNSGYPVTIYPVATDTTYTAATDIGSVSDQDSLTTPTTTYSYVYYVNTVQPELVVTTLPAVSAAQNGTQTEGSGTQTYAWYDQQGNVVWSQDGDSYLTLNQYDATTGLLMESPECRHERPGAPQEINNAMDGPLSLPYYLSSYGPSCSYLVADGNDVTIDKGNNGKFGQLGDVQASTPTDDTSNTNAVTDYLYDSQGRIVQTLGPQHLADVNGEPNQSIRTATWTVYEDAIHQTITAQGYQIVGGSNYVVNPVAVEITDADGNVTDDIQATVTLSGSSPAWASTNSNADISVGATPLSALGNLGDVTPSTARPAYTAWTHDTYQNGLLTSTAVYYAIPSSGMGTASTGGNEASANYDQTQYGYDPLGRAEWTETPNGTITWNQMDVNGDVLSTWVGTDDVPTYDWNGDGVHNSADFAAWLATGPSGTQGPSGTNMVEVSSATYDADSDLTQSTDYQYNGAASVWYGSAPTARVTDNYYDWRDRLVETKSGVLLQYKSGKWQEDDTAELADNVQRPITYYVLDNLGDVSGHLSLLRE